MRFITVLAWAAATVALAAVLAVGAVVAQAENWPHWRGPRFNGSTLEKGLPEKFGKAENVAWTAPLPGPSAATPIVWGDRVFLSSTEPATKGLVAMCLRAADGQVLWRKRLGADAKVDRNTLASPSPVTDGRLAYFLFGSGDLAALDFDGRVVWSRNLVKDFGNLALKYGYSSSPLLLGDRLYVAVLRRPKPYRGEAGAATLDSFLLAIDPATGKDTWREARLTQANDESHDSYASPVPYEREGRQEILMAGGDCVTSSDPTTGKELWRLAYNPARDGMWRLIPSVVTFDDLVLAVTPRGKALMAIRPLGTGTLAADRIAWTFTGHTSDSATPLLYDGWLYVLDSDAKVMTCLDPKTGQERWHGSLGGAVWRASPTGADGRIWCLSEDGEVAVLAAGDQFKVLFRVALGDGPAHASIAVANEHLYIRTASRLTCIGKPAAPVPATGPSVPTRR
jgi:outer membrane protein assembly factor BamB